MFHINKSMFNTSKYTNWYYSIIKRAQARTGIVGYSEKHHIIPKSLGGSNKKDNLVKLTAREHFICHLLLPKMVEDLKFKKQMQFALWMFVGGCSRDRKLPFNSDTYERAKKAQAILAAEVRTGCKHSEESKKLIGAKSAKKVYTDEYRKKLSDANRRREYTDEMRKNNSEAAKKRWAALSPDARRERLAAATAASLESRAKKIKA